MYELRDSSGNVVNWTMDLKNAFEHGITRCRIGTRGYLITESGVIVQNNRGNNIIVTGGYDENNKLLRAELSDCKYVENLGFIGQATSKKLIVELQSSTYVSSMENKEFTFEIGADYNGETYYINYGKFIVNKSPQNDTTSGKVTFEAYDYMIKFNKPYTLMTAEEWNEYFYPLGATSIKGVLEHVCSQAGVELGSNTFNNYNYPITYDMYAQLEGLTCREVLQQISLIAFSWARINQDNKLYLDFVVTSISPSIINPLIMVGTNDYYANCFKRANENYGVINKVTLSYHDIKGQEASIENSSSIEQNGLKELVLYDSLLAYTMTIREELIQAASSLLRFFYMPIQQMENCGLVHLCPGDQIILLDTDGKTLYTYVFNQVITYNGAVRSNITAPSISENEQTYFNTKNSNTSNNKPEIIIDRANNTITASVKAIGEAKTTAAQALIAADNINLKVEAIVQPNLLVNSNFATGNYNSWEERLNLSTKEVVSYIGKQWLHIANTDTTQALPGMRQIVRNIITPGAEYTVSLLAFTGLTNPTDNQKTLNVDIQWLNGSTTVSYTTIPFVLTRDATQYSATINAPDSQMDSFSFKLQGVTNTIFDFYITNIKFEKNDHATDWIAGRADTIKSEINLSPESVLISSDNISLAGKIIQLTSDNIAINSTNFSVTKDGVINAVSGNIAGWDITNDSIIKTYNNYQVAMRNASNANRDFLVIRTGTAGNYLYPFYVRGDGTIHAEKGDIGGISINYAGLFSYGTGNYEGFGIWKHGIHASENDYIVFHAGGNTNHIGDSRFRVYESGKVITRDSFYCYPDASSTQVIQICAESDRAAGHEDDRRCYMDSRGTMAKYDSHVAGFWVTNGNSIVQAEIFNVGYHNVIGDDTYGNMIIETDGDLLVQGIGGTYKAVYASAFVQQSSKRYKENIKELTKDDLIMKLKPVKFDYKKDSGMKGKNIVGLIAEDVAKIDENLVYYKEIEDKKVPDGIDYTKLVPYLILKVQNQQNEIDELKAQIKEIKEKLNG